MYSSKPDGQYQRSSAPPQPYFQPEPPQYGQYPATGTPVQPLEPSPWSTGLCDCFEDAPSCCLTCWCPCITFGRIAEIVDRGSTSCGVQGALYALLAVVTGCGCVYSCVYRDKMRQQYLLPQTPCHSLLVHCCCETCALCQEYRELQHRGFDMALGWQGNVERQNRGVTMAPIAPGGMTR